MFINMRVIRRRKRRIAKFVLCIVVFILVLWILNSKLNMPSIDGGSLEALEGKRIVDTDNRPKNDVPSDVLPIISDSNRIPSGPEWVQTLGNFELTEEPIRNGPGEGGRAHNLRPEQENDANKSIAQYGMNMVCSDEISLDRTVPDLRHEECQHWNYPEYLPKVSVIIAFHNEGFSTLMRTVHSVLNRSPLQFLEEVLLVDDFSDKEDLKDKLESYIQRWRGRVRLIRNEEREGLINTRSRGAREAHSAIIVFLDAHCEVNKNWLPPLITPIYNNRTTMTVPIIDSIDSKNFEIRRVYGNNWWRGSFEWGLQFRENIVPAKELRGRKHHTEPYRSPTHAGGLFAINRGYFLELGTYDPGLLVWGGENFELSFKVWQCGGRILYVPCSKVGHVYKALMPFTFGNLVKKRQGDLILGNYRRVVETWMEGQYKEYFYRREPTATFVEMGDISEQLELKERLQCKSFEWYIKNVAYDVWIMSPAPPQNAQWGFLKNKATQSCIGPTAVMPPAAMASTACSTIVRLNVQGQLVIRDNCVIYVQNEVKYDHCMNVGGQWEYENTTHAMFHKGEGKCLAVDRGKRRHLSLLRCDSKDIYQQWLFIEVAS